MTKFSKVYLGVTPVRNIAIGSDVIDLAFATITYGTAPSIGTLVAVTDGQTVASILAALDMGFASLDPAGTVTLTAQLVVNGSVQAGGTVKTGDVLSEARFTASAAGAVSRTRTLALGLSVRALPVTIDVTIPLSIAGITEGTAVSTSIRGEASASDGSQITRVVTYVLNGTPVDGATLGAGGQSLTGVAYFTNGSVRTADVPVGPITIMSVAIPFDIIAGAGSLTINSMPEVPVPVVVGANTSIQITG